MKFLILTQYFPPETGAAQTRLGELSTQLLNLNHEVEVLTAMPNYPTGQIFKTYKNKFYIKETYKNVTVHRFWLFTSQGKSILRLFSYTSFMFTSIFGIFLCKKPDYIFINSGPLFLSIPGKILSFIWQKPIIFNVADLWPRSVEKLNATGATKHLLKLALYLESWSYASAKYITAVTEGIFDILRDEKSIKSSKLLFMPNGVNVNLYSPHTAMRFSRLKQNLKLDGKFIFIYPGNHGYAHALDNILKAAKLISDDLQENNQNNSNLRAIHILFVGGGSDKQRLITVKNEFKLGNVSFIDPVSQEDLVDYLHIADVGLINIKNTHLANETRPAKMFPIMSMQKPILFAGHGEGAEIIKKCQGGMVVEAENPEALKLAMVEMFNNKHDLNRMGLNNRKYVLDHFEFSKIVKEWLDDLQNKEAQNKPTKVV